MALGFTVRELKQRLSLREYAEWVAYARIEPFGEERADWRVAYAAAQAVNHSGMVKKAAQPKDFVLPIGGPPELQMTEEQRTERIAREVRRMQTMISGFAQRKRKKAQAQHGST